MNKGLSVWTMAMMAFGTVIGGSFFLGVSLAVREAGPAVILSFLIGGALVYMILYSLSEMTVADPQVGSFRVYAEQAFGRGTGFVVGWVYWTGLVLAMSSEATAVSIFIKGWFPSFSLTLIGAVIIIGVTLLNLIGTERLGKLESALAAVKVFAIVGFVILGVALIAGWNRTNIGVGATLNEPLLPNGIGGIAGSMLIVMFIYAGFEVIGLAAPEARNPKVTVPRAIRFTVFGLIGLYLASIMVLLPLVQARNLTGDASPFVVALTSHGFGWAGNVITIVLVTAILSTMIASTFGLARMLRSLAAEGHAPSWVEGRGNIPYKGILVSGAAMLAGLGLGLLLPKQVYLFLVSAGGFSLLFTYIVIIASHLKLRKNRPCTGETMCQVPGYPFSSWFTLISLVVIVASMPLVPEQGTGLVAGLALLAFYTAVYGVMKLKAVEKRKQPFRFESLNMETSEEISPESNEEEDEK